MRGLFRRAVVAAGAVAVVLGTGVGAAAASPAPPVLAFTPSTYDFGQVAEPTAQTFTLTNTGGSGTGPVTVTLVFGSPSFTVTADTCTGRSLGAASSCTVTVQFTPDPVGTFTFTHRASLEAFSRSAAAVFVFPLTGSSAALYWATDPGAPDTGTVTQAALTPGGGTATVATGQADPQYVAGDGNFIYWTNHGDGTIMVGAPAATPHPYITQRNMPNPPGVQLKPGPLALGGGYIYWFNETDCTIYRAGTEGSQNPGDVTAVLHLGIGGCVGMDALAVDSSYLYWAKFDGTIDRAPLTGGDPSQVTTLVSGQDASGLAVDGSHIYWVNSFGANGDPFGGTIMRANLDGTGVTTLVTGLAEPSGLALFGNHLYFAAFNASGIAIMAVPLNGNGNLKTLVSGLQQKPPGLAVGP